MTKMSSGDLRALLAAERADALSAMSASKLAEERAAALDYYLGDMNRNSGATAVPATTASQRFANVAVFGGGAPTDCNRFYWVAFGDQ